MPRYALFAYVDGADLEAVAESLEARSDSLPEVGAGLLAIRQSSIGVSEKCKSRSQELRSFGVLALLLSYLKLAQSYRGGSRMLWRSHDFLARYISNSAGLFPWALLIPRLIERRNYSVSPQTRPTLANCQPLLE